MSTVTRQASNSGKSGPRFGLILMIVGVLFGAGLIMYFFSAYHKESETITVPVSDQVLKNRFYAAEKLLREQDVAVYKTYSIGSLSPSKARGKAILVPRYNEYDQLSYYDIDRLMEWVDAGGHLIVMMNSNREDKAEEQHALLSYLDIEYTKGRHFGRQRTSMFKHQEQTYQVELGDEKSFQNNSGYQVQVLAANDFGNQAIQLTIGLGAITLLSDETFMRNPIYYNGQGTVEQMFDFFPESPDEHIGTADNAFFLSRLMSNVSSLSIMQTRQVSSQGLLSWFWVKIPQFLFAILLLCVVWLWWLRNRFGPLLPVASRSRRNYQDHLLATSRFLWRQDRGEKLLDKERHELQQLLARKHPNLSLLYDTDTQKLFEALAHKQQQSIGADGVILTPEQMQLAFFKSDKDQRQFIDISYYQQSLRAIL